MTMTQPPATPSTLRPTSPFAGPTELAAPPPSTERRLRAVREEMGRRGLAALVLVSPESLYYLLGLDYQGYFAFTALVIPTVGEPELVTRAMEGPTVRAQVPHCRHRPFQDGEDPATVVAAAVRGHVATGDALGVEDAAMFFPPRIRAALAAELPELVWVDASDLAGPLREVKDADEISATSAAARLSDAAMSAGIGAVRAGAREYEVAAAVYQAMVAAGGHTPGFAPLIRATARLDQEHVTWSDQELVSGDGVLLELSACVRRYHAPLTRTVFVGSAPPEAVIAHAAAQAGMRAIVDHLRPGAVAADVFAAWESAVAAVHPQSAPERHHCGYLVGIGFPPSWVGGGEVLGVRRGSPRVIRPGMTFHAMSWVRDPIGFVLSDTVLVREDGAERLTQVPQDLTIVP
ncbi:aminopeptidase P family protein [Spiractinospora alimapuensis]|uniref:M24 family metallopeptidase n=1 Tax=Spiractinospora alimapuensis TaxID=2820884 RepID=UPI001F36E616|nr:Xaa-Pro peptidase family protein [Spiractinospora alimapuensis]QVQ50636.1 aminopeptidase P family protein [Spiractinospora alimapuensis]